MYVLCSQTPGKPQVTCHIATEVLPSATVTASAFPMMPISGLYRTARTLAVYASQGGSPHHHARLASGRWLGFAGWGWLPTGFQYEVSRSISDHLSSSSRLDLAQHGHGSLSVGTSPILDRGYSQIGTGRIVRIPIRPNSADGSIPDGPGGRCYGLPRGSSVITSVPYSLPGNGSAPRIA